MHACFENFDIAGRLLEVNNSKAAQQTPTFQVPWGSPAGMRLRKGRITHIALQRRILTLRYRSPQSNEVPRAGKGVWSNSQISSDDETPQSRHRYSSKALYASIVERKPDMKFET